MNTHMFKLKDRSWAGLFKDLKLRLVNIVLLLRPSNYEYRSCEWYGRRKRIVKTFLGRSYYGPWEEADLLYTKGKVK